MSEEHLNYTSCFNIIGPIMIGPSSSHTAGACAIGKCIYDLFGKVPSTIDITYYESFAETHLGHGTDYALIGGILGMEAADTRVPHSLTLAQEQGIQITIHESKEESPASHPNTALVTVKDNDNNQLTVLGTSIGGGSIELCYINSNGIELEPTYTPNLIILQSNQSIPEDEINQQLKQWDIDVTNGQITYDEHRQMIALNTSRCLTEEEFIQLTTNLELTNKMMVK